MNTTATRAELLNLKAQIDTELARFDRIEAVKIAFDKFLLDYGYSNVNRLLADIKEVETPLVQATAPAPAPVVKSVQPDTENKFSGEREAVAKPFDLIDSDTMERALSYLKKGIPRADIVEKFNLNNFLSYEKNIVRGRGQWFTTTELTRVKFFLNFYKARYVTLYFNRTVYKYTSYRVEGRGRFMSLS